MTAPYEYRAGVRVGVIGTWGGAGPRVLRKGTKKQGQAISFMGLANASHQGWVVVVWDDATGPTCEPSRSLLFKHTGERKFKPEVIP